MMKTIACGLFLLFLASSPSYALPGDAIGHIHTEKGTAWVTRGTVSVAATVGAPLYCGDEVRTGNPGSVGIVLTDDTTISLGPNPDKPEPRRINLELRKSRTG
jgi:hypothetical protein